MTDHVWWLKDLPSPEKAPAPVPDLPPGAPPRTLRLVFIEPTTGLQVAVSMGPNCALRLAELLRDSAAALGRADRPVGGMLHYAVAMHVKDLRVEERPDEPHTTANPQGS